MLRLIAYIKKLICPYFCNHITDFNSLIKSNKNYPVESRHDLHVIQNTAPAMVYIELGNIKNAKDQKRILDFENRDALAKWIAEELETDFTQN